VKERARERERESMAAGTSTVSSIRVQAGRGDLEEIMKMERNQLDATAYDRMILEYN